MKNIYISIFEGIYICFMFNYFKTKYSFNHPLESIITQNYNFIKHPINSGNYESKICPLGHLVGWILPIWMIFYGVSNANIFLKIIHRIIWGLVFILSFILNMNAWIYLLPVFIIESYLEFLL